MEATTPIDKIKLNLTLCCLYNDVQSFLPFLMLDNVKTDAPDKRDFYDYFTHMLNDAHLRAKGKVTMKFENPTWEADIKTEDYNFYDSTHIYPLLSIAVKESDNQIHLDIMPF
jgi:hypothetical protein